MIMILSKTGIPPYLPPYIGTPKKRPEDWTTQTDVEGWAVEQRLAPDRTCKARTCFGLLFLWLDSRWEDIILLVVQ